MSSLANQQQNTSFPGLLQVPGGITSTLQQVQDGNGNVTGLSISSAGASVTTSDTFQASKNGTTLTGALPRLISDGFGDLPTVKDFGAIGDGVIDDTAAFTAAIAASPTGVAIPAGSYKITGTVTGIFYSFGVVTIVTGTVNTISNLASLGTSTGSTFVSTTNGGTGSITRTVAAKLNETVSVKDFGAVGDGVTDDTAAIQVAINYAISSGGIRLNIPKGTYIVSSTIALAGLNNTFIYGDGQDSTIIKTNATTGDVFYNSGNSFYNTFRDFSITSSVTRTSGAMIHVKEECRALFERIKISKHFDGINFEGAEITYLKNSIIVDPTGAGTAIIIGSTVLQQSVSGLCLDTVTTRGTSDTIQPIPIVGLYGIWIHQSDAVYAVNCDIGGNAINGMLIDGAAAPQGRNANHYFQQCFFDATAGGDCVKVTGSGSLVNTSFDNCWFSGGGVIAPYNNEACGIYLDAITQGYQGIQFTGCNLHSSRGAGVYINSANADFMFTGCVIEGNGLSATTNKYGVFNNNASAQFVGAQFVGCRISGNGTGGDLDVYSNANSRFNFWSGCFIDSEVSDIGAYNQYSGIQQKQTTVAYTIASATQPRISPAATFVVVTGTTNIAGIYATFAGHQITLKFDAADVVIDSSMNLQLAGNFASTANSTLTLVCDGATWFEVCRSIN
jgi:hypothetical protein